MKTTFLCISSFLLCLFHQAPGSESSIQQHEHTCAGFEFRSQSNISATQGTPRIEDKYVACEVYTRSAKDIKEIQIKRPFISKKSTIPLHIRNTVYFRGISTVGEYGLSAEPDESFPVWDFSNVEARNLDFRIRLRTSVNVDTQTHRLVDNFKEMTTDLIYFIPYTENENDVYFLTWNLKESVQGGVAKKDNTILFPVVGEERSMIGMFWIKSLFTTIKHDESLDMQGKVGHTHYAFELKYQITDSAGDVWILAWKKLNKADFSALFDS